MGQVSGSPVEITNSIGMKLVLIPPGEFTMGSPKELIEEELKAHAGDQWWVDRLPGEGPQHRVRITRPFYLGTYLVTQQEYQRVMGTNPSEFSATGKGKEKVAGKDTKRFPVDSVSWNDALEFCRKLSELPEEKAAGRVYRLPSEAQWEHACRAGNAGRYGFSSGRSGVPKEYEEKELSDYGWFGGNGGGMTHAVGGKRPGAWGLYDMHGNVWEWCQDWYDKDYYVNSPTDDPAGPSGGSSRVERGEGWNGPAGICRSAYRDHNEPGNRDHGLGFRVSLVLVDTAAERANMIRLTDTAKPSGGSTAAKPLAFETPGFQQWMKEVAALPAEKQVEAVAKKVQELNPGFDGKVTGYGGQGTPGIENGVVRGMGVCTDEVTDISPLRVLGRLSGLGCNSNWNGKSKFSDLSPLTGMPLTDLRFNFTMVSDLSPLKGMPLTFLECSHAKVVDLSPLRGMPLSELVLEGTKVSDLSPLQGMPLARLECYNTEVRDLSPLQGMPLTTLTCNNTPVSDLSPLKGMPLKHLACDLTQVSDLSPLEGMNLTTITFTPKNITKGIDAIRNMKSLKSIELSMEDKDKFPPAEFWKKYEAGEFGKATTTVDGPSVQQQIKEVAPPPAVAPFDATKAKEHQAAWAKHLRVPVEETNSIGMKLVLIPPGEFTMGSPKELIEEELKARGADQWYKERLPGEGPQHRVRITRPFYLETYLVTQQEYQRVMGTNPSRVLGRRQGQRQGGRSGHEAVSRGKRNVG